MHPLEYIWTKMLDQVVLPCLAVRHSTSPLAGSELEPNDIVDSFVAALTAEARWAVN